MQVSETTPAPSETAGASGDAQFERRSMNRTAQLMVAWSGIGMLVMILFGLLFARYLFPWTSPGDTAEEVARIYQEHSGRIRTGVIFTLAGFGMIAVWGVGMAVQTRRKEGVFPVLTYAQLTTMSVGAACLMVQSCFWATAAFRAGDAPAEITRALNDAGYITLLATWLPFTAWTFALGLSVLLDRSTTPVYPRWTGYLSIWAGILFIPGNTVWFFKSGAFGWTGVICLYVPIVAFGIWVAVFTWFTIKNIKGGLVHEQDLAPAS